MKKDLHAVIVMMSIAMLFILGFQAWWLRDSYEREKNSLTIKADVKFQETVHELQTQKLMLPGSPGSDSTKMKVFINDDEEEKNDSPKKNRTHDIVTTLNIIRDKLSDTTEHKKRRSGFIVMDNSTTDINDQSLPGRERHKMVQYLSGVDSVQDSLRVADINKKFSSALKAKKLNIPFSVLRIDSLSVEESMSDVTIGFVHPITYRLVLGNVFPAVFKKLTVPVIFSAFLAVITIFSFLVLYRNIVKQQRLAEMKNDLISNITHELKTPLATVGVAIEAMKNFSAMHDEQKRQEYLDISSGELQRLNLLVDKVLRLSMFEKKQLDLRYEAVDILEVVNEVVNSMRLQIEKCNAVVTVNADGHPVLTADRLHLMSVIFNLLDNALKYNIGNPVVNIQVKENKDDVMLDVNDNGIGIPAEYKEKVFEKFFRIPTGNKHNTKGYGLGLSYVAHVVEKHKGSIKVATHEGTGASFSIVLPKQTA